MVGALAAFVWLNRQHLGGELTAAWRRNLTQILIMTVLISLMPGVSWEGHLGGAVVGLAAGALLNYQRFGTAAQRWAAVLGLLVLAAVCVGAVYRSPAVARLREAWIGEAERQAIIRAALEEDQIRQRELADFSQRVMPEFRRVSWLGHLVCYLHADPLLRMPPAVRDGAQVRAALGELAALADEQSEAAKLFDQAGPYQTPSEERRRQGAVDHLAQQRRWAELYGECLRAGTVDEARHRDQLRRLDEAARYWHALYGGPRPLTVLQ
jgi:hypothetical protein